MRYVVAKCVRVFVIAYRSLPAVCVACRAASLHPLVTLYLNAAGPIAAFIPYLCGPLCRHRRYLRGQVVAAPFFPHLPGLVEKRPFLAYC